MNRVAVTSCESFTSESNASNDGDSRNSDGFIEDPVQSVKTHVSLACFSSTGEFLGSHVR